MSASGFNNTFSVCDSATEVQEEERVYSQVAQTNPVSYNNTENVLKSNDEQCQSYKCNLIVKRCVWTTDDV